MILSQVFRNHFDPHGPFPLSYRWGNKGPGTCWWISCWWSHQGRGRVKIQNQASSCWLKKSPLIGYSLQVNVVFLAFLRPFNVLLFGYPCGPMTLSDPPCSLICKHMYFLQRVSLSFFFLLHWAVQISRSLGLHTALLSNPGWMCEILVCPKVSL